MRLLVDEFGHMIVLPHVLPYQGSKRRLASKILGQIKYRGIHTFYEPFAGSAAMTIAAASANVAEQYVLGEKLEPLAKLWETIIWNPERVIDEYTCYWNEQAQDPKTYFNQIRAEYNEDNNPSKLLYLIARCVKNAVRFSNSGDFNQSADHRRLGMRPEKLKKHVLAASKLLGNRTEVVFGDFTQTLNDATSSDLIYLDPPWMGFYRNPRYAYSLEYASFIKELERLNRIGIPFLLSFDGTCGNRSYIKELPSNLDLLKLPLAAGRSSQATLLGREENTIESLYLSPALQRKNEETG